MEKAPNHSRENARVSPLNPNLVAAEIDSDESSAIASRDDLAKFAKHRDFLLGSHGGTQLPHSYDINYGYSG